MNFLSKSNYAEKKFWYFLKWSKDAFINFEIGWKKLINPTLCTNQGNGFCTGSDDSTIILHDIRADQSLAVYAHEELKGQKKQ